MWKNKFKGQTSVRKVLARVFWDCEAILFMEFLKRGAATNSERYVHARNNDFEEFGQTGRRTKALYFLCPELAPPDFHIFWTPEGYTLRTSFCGRQRAKHWMREELRRFSEEFEAIGIKQLMQRWKNYIDNEEQFVEKQSQLCE